ncbi:alpha/beta fold hydrolase [Paucidesulfovibrio longus]|uniref:alpha/beta fold hydrolase n=1 Tax=Paucidesulfovibrio longus TaxID=889 RepID=UPI0003B2E2B8|nr:alpha/beta hydrolase [Paucidesulfovibrio longus]
MIRNVAALLILLLLLPAAGWALSPRSDGVADLEGTRLAYRIYGQGKPLLLITGYGASMETWPELLLKALARERRVVLFDNRGIARSTADDSPLSIALMAEDAASLLRALDVESAEVLGWSMGGSIAQELALAHPQMVEKLVLYATDFENAGVLAALARIEARRKAPGARPADHLFPAAWMDAHPDYLSVFPAVTVPPDPAAVARQKQALVRWPGTLARLGEIRSPVLFVVGEEDEVTPADRSRMAVSRMGGPAWLAVFENAGHGLMFQAPEDFARLVLDFLDLRQRVE